MRAWDDLLTSTLYAMRAAKAKYAKENVKPTIMPFIEPLGIIEGAFVSFCKHKNMKLNRHTRESLRYMFWKHLDVTDAIIDEREVRTPESFIGPTDKVVFRWRDYDQADNTYDGPFSGTVLEMMGSEAMVQFDKPVVRGFRNIMAVVVPLESLSLNPDYYVVS